MKSQLIGKDPDAGKDWRQYKGTTEDKMVGWHHWPDEHELSKLWEMVRDCVLWAAVHGSQRVKHDWATEQQSSIYCFLNICFFVSLLPPTTLLISTSLNSFLIHIVCESFVYFWDWFISFTSITTPLLQATSQPLWQQSHKDIGCLSKRGIYRWSN